MKKYTLQRGNVSTEFYQSEEYKKNLKVFKSKINSMKVKDITKSLGNSKQAFMRYDIEQIAKFMMNPNASQKQLREVSRYFYTVSGLYRNIVRYLALMPTYYYSISPVKTPDKIDKAKYLKAFKKSAKLADRFIQPRELIKASLVSWKEDVFYGYEMYNGDSFFFLQLDPDYCQISSIQDGVYNYAFDLKFFDVNKNELNFYPEELKVAYEIWKGSKGMSSWYEPNWQNQFCLKANIESISPLPPMSPMFGSLMDLADYKGIKKIRALNDNFMALIQKIPIDEKNPDINKFLIDLELAMQFHNMASDSLPDGVSLITSPMSIEAVKTDKSKSDSDQVSQAYREAFSDAGVSQFLFNSDKNSSVGLSSSIKEDEQQVFVLLRQIEAWVNRKLAQESGTYNFQVDMLDITVYNKEEVRKGYLEAGQNGVPVKMELAASHGINPNKLLHKLELENDVLDLNEKFIPLATSHTQTGEGQEAGRPPVSEDEASEGTIVSRDRESDSRRTEG